MMAKMFVRNQWYALAWGREIGEQPFARTICGEPIVAYRKADGTIAAMRDACPHRLLPLSMGIREGDSIRCRYHGLLIGPDGRAIEMPIRNQPVPPRLCAEVYPAVERYSFVWVWIGETEKADEKLLPDLWMCEREGWGVDGDTYHVACDYRLLIDNLMDLTHETYVHASTIGQKELMDAPLEARSQDGMIVLERWMADIPPAPAYRGRYGGGNVDRWQICYFLPPSCVIIDVGVAPVSAKASLADHPVSSFVIDIMSPESETTTHYFWGAARMLDGADDAAQAERVKALQRAVFAEDVEILEAQQRSIRLNDDLALRNFNIDAGGVRSRRIIDRMLKADQDPSSREDQ